MEQNLTDPIMIKAALEQAKGRGALAQIAAEQGVTRSAVTLAVKGLRPNSALLPAIAGAIGQTVHGVAPFDCM